MRIDWQNERWITVVFIAASGFILFFNLWGRSLENHSYLRYAEVAREMIRSGDWVIPRLNGEVYVNKPPLLFWLIALPSSLYGSVTPFLAKLPVALSAWAGVLVVFLWGKRLYGTARAGLISGGILLSCYQYWSQSRLAKTDILLTLLFLLSFYFFSLGFEINSRKRTFYFAGSFFFMGLGVLVKGPFGFLIPFLILVAFLIKEKRAGWLISRGFLTGYGVFLLTVLPWALLFIHRIGFQESLTLIKASHPFSRQAPFYFYLLEIWGQFSPWSILLPFLGFSIWRDRFRVWKSTESLVLLWFALQFIALTFFKVRVSRYLLPALPPLALMTGGRWHHRLLFFLIPFLLMVSILHAREIYWIRNDLRYSPGRILTGELEPVLEEKAFWGFDLDISTLEELNFHLDPPSPVPHLNRLDDLYSRLKEGEEIRILTTERGLKALQAGGKGSVTPIQAFSYKKGRLLFTRFHMKPSS